MTIYALSSGPGKSGIAVIRVSGSKSRNIIELLTNRTFPKYKKRQNSRNNDSLRCR